MRSTEKVIEQIRNAARDLGSDPDKDLQITHNEGHQSIGGKTQKVVFASIRLKIYWYPKAEYYIMVEKYVDWFDRSIDCMAAIHKFLHGRVMNLVHGLESLEEAFGANMVLSQSKLPPAAMDRLINGPKAPFKFDRMLNSGKEVQ
jgi:hypothetical protein